MDIYGWTAKRAGAAMTVHGFDADDKPVKAVGVQSIFATPAGTAYGAVIAKTALETHRLFLRGGPNRLA